MRKTNNQTEQMKHQSLLLLAAVAMLLLAGCKEKKQADDVISMESEVVSMAPSAPVRMQEFKQSKQVNWVGRTYTVEVLRQASDSLPMVKDDSDQEFVDNRVSLRVIRADGSVFFSKAFTKHHFEAYLDEAYRSRGILEGLVFDKVDGNTLVFAASVSFPQTDEYIPLQVKVDNYGSISISRDNQLDTYGDEEDE